MNKISQLKAFLIGLIFSSSTSVLNKRTTKAIGAFNEMKAELGQVIQQADKRDAALEKKRQAAYKKYVAVNKSVLEEQDSLIKLRDQNVKIIRNIDTLIG